jgi:hypothetical protein
VDDNIEKFKFSKLEIYNYMCPVILKIIIIVIIHLLNCIAIRGDRCAGLTTLPLSYTDCLEMWEP